MLKIIKEFSNEVKLIEREGKFFIYKKIVLPITLQQEKEKKNFVDFLYNNNVKVARIIEFYQDENGDIIEIQEYLNNEDNKIEIEDELECLANFHKVSKQWSGKNFNKKEYNLEGFCCNVRINKILLGFYEKYYKYPLNSYHENIKRLPTNMVLKTEKIVNSYKNIFDFFVKKYNTKSCLCHNDFTINNVINYKGKPHLIDFDFSICTSEYVDVIDSLLIRKCELKNLVLNYKEIKKEIMFLMNTYNQINNILEIDGIISMMIIKIVSFNLYINLNKNDLEIFETNAKDIYDLMVLIEKDLNIN